MLRMAGPTMRRLTKAAHLLNPVTLLRTLDRVDQLAQATRDLTKSVDHLRVRTEQLLTIQQMDWERREELEALPSQLDEARTSAHVSRAIAAARIHDEPFPHLVLENWLPRDVYDTIIRALPPSIFFADRDESRQRLIVPFGIAPEYSRRVWAFMAHRIVGDMVASALSEKLLPLLRDYVRSFCPDMPEGVDLTLHASNGRIMLRRPGYVITPHRDPKWGFITCLVYLARRGDNETYGTQLYRVKNDEEAPSGKPFYVDESRCELVKSVPFRANTMLIFLNSRGAHGASIPADAQPPDLERYLYQFRLGPDNRAIAELLARMPEASRVMWAGSKADRVESY
jgi:hypothetical protein